MMDLAPNVMETITADLSGTVPGVLAFVLIASATLALPVSFLLLHAYRRAVVRTMRTHGGSAPRPGSAPMTDAAGYTRTGRPSVVSSDVLYRRAIDGQRRVVTTYVIGGMLFATVIAGAFMVSGRLEFAPMPFLMLWWTYAWPVVLTTNLVSGVTFRRSLVVAGLYFLGFAGVCGLALARNPDVTASNLILLWLATNGPASALLALFLMRRVRAVGPLVLVFIVLGVIGSNANLGLIDRQEGILRIAAGIGMSIGLNAWGVFLGLILVGFVLLGFVGWALLRWIAARYEQKKLSDLSLMVDAIWLFFGMVYAIGLLSEGLAWIIAGPAAFAMFKIASRLTFSFGASVQRDSGASPELLLLRVFSLGKRSERLYDAFGGLWRFAGQTRMIAGPDLATTTIEPHEFLRFVSGKLDGMFIDGTQTPEPVIRDRLQTRFRRKASRE